MATLEKNKSRWDGTYDWRDLGDEWSASWGGPAMQWYGCILPRIHQFVPTQSILEIACGCGRWTQFLKDLCTSLTALDLSEKCIATCKQRFADCAHIKCVVNDGTSLDMIPDHSIDFIFTYDSLVHADAGVLRAYIDQFPRILTENGAAFVHHSNLGAYAWYRKVQKRPLLCELLRKLGMVERTTHARDWGVTAQTVEEDVRQAGLECVSQELVTWGTKTALIDCMTMIVRKGSQWSQDHQLFRNHRFMQEASYLSQLSRLYCSAGAPKKQPGPVMTGTSD